MARRLDLNPSVYAKMPFDSLEDITPIAVIGTTPIVLVVNPDEAPAKLPAVQVKRLHGAFAAAFADTDVQEAMTKQGIAIKLGTPEAAVRFFRGETANYGRLVKQAGVKID